MFLTPLRRKALHDITRRRARTVLVILGIGTGVAGLTAVNLTSGQLYSAFAYSASERATSDVSVFIDSVDPGIERSMADLPGVQAAQVLTFYPTRWEISASPGHVNMSIDAAPDLAHMSLYPFQLTAGRYPGVGEVVMESSDRSLQPFSLGSRITIDTARGPASLRVVGLSRTLGQTSASFANRARAYMSEDGLAALRGARGANDIELQVRSNSQTSQVVAEAESLLRHQGAVVLGASLNGNYFDASVVSGLWTILNVLSAVALLLTGLLIVNTVSTLVGEQVGIIGTMKAIGAPRSKVVTGFLQTVLTYALVGTSVGLLLGVIGGLEFTHYLASIITLDLGPFQPDPGVFVLAVAVGILVPVLAALVPLWAGTAITVREALQAYGVQDLGAGRVSLAVGRLLGWVPQTVWLGLRGLFRRRARAALTLLALTFSATVFLAVQTTTYSVNGFLDQLFSQYGADVFVGVDRPLPTAQARAELMSVPGVAHVETFDNTYVNSPWGHVVLTGVEDDPHLYHPDVLQGRWWQPGQQRVVLVNQQLASTAHLSVGSHLRFSTPSGEMSWPVIGVVHDLNGGLGTSGVALTPTASLALATDREPGYSGSFMVGARSHGQAFVDALATRLDAKLAAGGLEPSISTAHQQIVRNQGQFQILYYILYVVAAIVAVVGILGLFNTLMTSVLERRREIGILRSLGATGRRVAAVFWTEAVALALIAWALALVIGVPAAYAFVGLIAAVLVPISFTFNPTVFAAMLAFMVVLALLSGAGPALGASRLRVVEILRYE